MQKLLENSFDTGNGRKSGQQRANFVQAIVRAFYTGAHRPTCCWPSQHCVLSVLLYRQSIAVHRSAHFPYPDAPIMEYFATFGQCLGVNVGKYSSTMEHGTAFLAWNSNWVNYGIWG